MSTIAEQFSRLRSRHQRGLITYLTAGFPDRNTSLRLMENVEKWGTDLLEIGVPFSDPIADGPVIQQTSQVALAQGMNLGLVFQHCQHLAGHLSIPYLLMTYYNPVYQYGLKNFARDCRKTGVSGIIVPDLSLEESEPLRSLLREQNIDLIQFVTPFTPLARMKRIVRLASGFLYVVSVAGVTGERKSFDPLLIKCLKQLRNLTRLPLAVGFGVSTPEQIKYLAPHVDAVIIGSYFLRRLADGKIEEVEKSMANFKVFLTNHE
ncbi:MAG TPA: tryptophan synthase subunit alpha [bacterium]|nr:tryptophan synthase subunit alpha [bacterium]HPP12308.1 tryptophan synthase subunit alpha [bacterium]